MTVARILENQDHEIVTCPIDAHVNDALAILAEYRIGAVPIVDGEKVVGIFSERDIVYQLQAFGPAMLEKNVSEVMTSPVISITPDAALLEALSMMTRRRIRHLPVLEGEKMVGFVSIGDLVKYRIDQVEAEAEAMRQYIQSS